MSKIAKFFNTAGPIKANLHYKIDPLKRFELDEILNLIDSEKYFIMHAPRQTGKTSSLLALRDYLNKQGKYHALYINVEAGQAFRNDVETVINGVVETIQNEVSIILGDDIAENNIFDRAFSGKTTSALTTLLKSLSAILDKPLVLFIDEIDALVGDSLISVLRQIRAGYANRPAQFPQSIVLCGVRDVRDYRIHTSQNEIITGGSAYNIKSESLRLGNFSKDEICELYQQHTTATGQHFTKECIDLAWQYTEGQPWLVNALGYEVTYKMKENRDRNVTIADYMIRQAKENIVLRRDTHIDILIDKLKEKRVKRVIEPMLSADEMAISNEVIPTDDIMYVHDLGLITLQDKTRRIANAIYKEIIPRELTWSTQTAITEQTAWYINPDNSLNITKLLESFQQFYRKNAEAWIEHFAYRESGPQLLLQAFLQRIVNGGGFIDREYGLGRGRTDLLITKKLTEGFDGPEQRVVMELKVKRKEAMETIIADGLRQTYKYMNQVGVSEGNLIIFDNDMSKDWNDKIWHRTETYNNQIIEVWGM